MNYFLKATRELTYAEVTLGEWRTRYYGQEPGKHGSCQGTPRGLQDFQAQWLGPKLAREWRCQVEAQQCQSDPSDGMLTVACWRYNAENGAAETVQEWGDTGHAAQEQQACTGVSGNPPPTAGGSSASAGATTAPSGTSSSASGRGS